MKVITVDLYKYFNVKRPEGAQGFLTVYQIGTYSFVQNRRRPAVLVIAGGGYEYVSQREKEPIALWYVAQGFNAFTLEYSVEPVSYPAQLLEGAMAMAYIRENAKEYSILEDKVLATGFSAGGHLCAMLGTLFNEQVIKDALGERAKYCKPNGLVLCYPVLTMGEKTHEGSAKRLIGGKADLRQELSLENRVTKDTPPCFIWHTTTDAGVPVENSLYFALALKKNGVPFELHSFREGGHGASLCTVETVTINNAVSKWKDLLVTWLNETGYLPTIEK